MERPQRSPAVESNLSLSGRLLRIAILGAGTIARDHARAIHALGHTVSAACSKSSDSCRWREFSRVAPEARFEPCGEALLEDPEIDAVVACLPWNVTEGWLPRLLGAPKPVLVEKPIALFKASLEAALQRLAGSLSNKIVGFNRRFYEPVQRVKRRLSEGGLKAVEIAIAEPLESYVNKFGPEIIPHVLVYSSCHILDAALFLLGPLRPVRFYRHSEKSYPVVFHSMTGLMETFGGVPIALSIHADAPVPVGMRFYFDDRTVWHLSPMERLAAYRGYEITEPTPDAGIRRYTPKRFFDCAADASIKPGFLAQMRAFTTGEGIESAATPADSLALLSLIETLEGATPEVQSSRFQVQGRSIP